jgi:arylsulfatase A-like enzyme
MYPKQIDQGLGKGNVNLTLNWKDKDRELCQANPDHYNYTIDAFHDAGVAWLEDVAVGEKPFFMYLSFTVPHAGGWQDAPNNKEEGNPVPTTFHYDDKSWPDVERDHAAVITYLDAKVGDLMARLKKLGVDDNTLVVFASDNGAHHEGGHQTEFFNSTGGLQGQKRSLCEGGVRSPTMARWPAKIKAGQVSSFPWAFWDVMPTFAELAGAEAPEGLDGISIVPELTGEGQQAEHEYLYWTWGAGKNRGYSVRVGNWKGVVPTCADASNLQPSLDDEMFLYDVVNDAFETQDRSGEKAQQIKKLKELVIAKNLTCQCYQC